MYIVIENIYNFDLLYLIKSAVYLFFSLLKRNVLCNRLYTCTCCINCVACYSSSSLFKDSYNNDLIKYVYTTEKKEKN